jgi:hypothetical protein
MKKIIWIVLGLIIVVTLATLYSFPEVTESYYDETSTAGFAMGNLDKDKEVQVTFISDRDHLSSISLRMETLYRTGLTTLDVLIEHADVNVVARKTIDLKDVSDKTFYKISFDPYIHSRNETFTVTISSPDAVEGQAIALQTYDQKNDSTRLYVNGAEQDYAIALRASYTQNFEVTTFVVCLFFATVVLGFITFINKYI